jgi:hypothetical protein
VDFNLGGILGVSEFKVGGADKVVFFNISTVLVSTVVVLGCIVCVIAEEGKTRTKFDVKLVANKNVVFVTCLVVVGNNTAEVI